MIRIRTGPRKAGAIFSLEAVNTTGLDKEKKRMRLTIGPLEWLRLRFGQLFAICQLAEGASVG